MDVPSYLLGKKASGGGGGGTTYTAGTNIEITNENVINNLVDYSINTTGNNQMALGKDAIASYSNSCAVGNNAKASSASLAVGNSTSAETYNSLAIGYSSKTYYNQSIALGAKAKTTKANQMVVGSDLNNINEMAIYTSNGLKTMATQDYADSKAIQTSIMETASSDNLGKIIQYIGTTDGNYTNGYFYKCVSDGQDPATYSWEEVEVQANSGGSSYTAGTNIEITSENVINNKIPYLTNNHETYPSKVIGTLMENTTMGTNAIGIGNEVNVVGASSIAIGRKAEGKLENAIAIGSFAKANGNQTIAIGISSQANNAGMAIGREAKAEQKSIAFGWGAKTTKAGQVMFGGTFMSINELAIYDNGVTKIMATQEFVQNYLTTVSGYDSTKTQVLKNINGTMTWVDE